MKHSWISRTFCMVQEYLNNCIIEYIASFWMHFIRIPDNSDEKRAWINLYTVLQEWPWLFSTCETIKIYPAKRICTLKNIEWGCQRQPVLVGQTVLLDIISSSISCNTLFSNLNFELFKFNTESFISYRPNTIESILYQVTIHQVEKYLQKRPNCDSVCNNIHKIYSSVLYFLTKAFEGSRAELNANSFC